MKTAVAAGDEERPNAVEIVLAMLRSASQRTRKEVHRLLAADLSVPPTAAETRVAMLGFLSSLLAGPPKGALEFRECERQEYDRLRPSSAPSSRRLVDLYGSWSRACRAAYGLKDDGTTEGPGKPWPTGNRGDRGRHDYTREEAIAAVRLCAKELRAAGVASAPTCWQYDEWVRRQKLAAKKQGRKLRMPYAHSIYRLFPKRSRGESRWRAILKAAEL